MISEKQFQDSTDFLASYKDALECVEKIAEQKQAFNHYEKSCEQIVGAMENDEIKLSGSNVVQGSNASSFIFSRAFA